MSNLKRGFPVNINVIFIINYHKYFTIGSVCVDASALIMKYYIKTFNLVQS